MAELALTTLNRTFLWEEAASAIRRAIITGELQDGEQVSEAFLAQRLGVSRAPVRDAMRMLIQEGLLVQQNGTTVVGSWTEQDIQQLYELRLYLEALAVRKAAVRMDTTAAAALGERVKAMRRAAAAGQAHEFAAADLAFHRAICQAAGHRWLLVAWDTLAATLEVALAFTDLAYSEGAGRIADEHAQLVELLRQGNASAAEAELRRMFALGMGMLSAHVAATGT